MMKTKYEIEFCPGEDEKENPIKIEFNYHARGFYCPTCSTGVANKDQKCPFCGQQLLDAYNEHMKGKQT